MRSSVGTAKSSILLIAGVRTHKTQLQGQAEEARALGPAALVGEAPGRAPLEVAALAQAMESAKRQSVFKRSAGTSHRPTLSIARARPGPINQ